MKSEKIVNKDGQVLTTKDGKELYENTLELGDQFLLQAATVNVNEKGKYPNYSILVRARKVEFETDATGTKFKRFVREDGKFKVIENYRDAHGSEEFWVRISPGQNKQIENRIAECKESGENILEQLFFIGTYEHDKHGLQLGIYRVSTTEFKKGISFDQYDSLPEEEKSVGKPKPQDSKVVEEAPAIPVTEEEKDDLFNDSL